mgnify:FL=1
MIAIQIADFYILKKKSADKLFQWRNLFIWLIGFILYRILMRIDIVCGNTLPDMLITIALCLIAAKIVKENGLTLQFCSNYPPKMSRIDAMYIFLTNYNTI